MFIRIIFYSHLPYQGMVSALYKGANASALFVFLCILVFSCDCQCLKHPAVAKHSVMEWRSGDNPNPFAI